MDRVIGKRGNARQPANPLDAIAGGAKVKKSPADIMADTARVLYDDHGPTPHWRMAVARGLRVDPDTIRRWMSGKTPLRPGHPIMAELLILVRNRGHEIGHAGNELEQWIEDNAEVHHDSKR